MARNHFWGAALFPVFVKGAGFAIDGRKTRTLENRKGAAPGEGAVREAIELIVKAQGKWKETSQNAKA
jgi:3-deoxy-D-manno-octulosonate 8-phosphate phosphatase KdsC-like HAD superfamily phosphatase